ncbi:MAG: slipin family protein [Candidatus Marinimicrobia bacterium]|nr:slipin family protein [Candidatus Neomarinimicrobiota bacterium]
MAQIVLIIIVVIFFLTSALKVVREYDRGVIFRLGRLIGAKGPGLIILIPIIDKMVKVSLIVVTLDIPSQDIITKDNVSVKVNAVLYFRVVDPQKAIVEVEDYLFATGQLAQTTLRSILGQVELDELLSNREEINDKMQKIVDEQTDAWGIKVSLVELKHVDLPSEMQRAMAKQAEAERDRRAKIIHAEGEFQASENLAKAAEVIGRQPAALQLRYLQTLTEVAAENNSTLVFPLPIEFLKAFSGMVDKSKD